MKTVPLSSKAAAGIWAALLLLLFLTWGLAQVDLGPFNNLAALGIAFAKMTLVLLFFMHLRWSNPLTWMFAAAGFVWLLIMLDLTLSDYLTRSPGWSN
jgi:cytochrome c oxidase subunit 4